MSKFLYSQRVHDIATHSLQHGEGKNLAESHPHVSSDNLEGRVPKTLADILDRNYWKIETACLTCRVRLWPHGCSSSSCFVLTCKLILLLAGEHQSVFKDFAVFPGKTPLLITFIMRFFNGKHLNLLNIDHLNRNGSPLTQNTR